MRRDDSARLPDASRDVNRLAALLVLSIVGCAVGTAPEPTGRTPFAGETAAPEGETPEAESLIVDEGSMGGGDADEADAGAAKTDAAASSDAKSPQDASSNLASEASAPPACPGYALPDESAGCKACQQSSPTCQPNGCYNGYYCEVSVNKCRPKPGGC